MYVGDVPSAVELAVRNPMGGYNDHFDATAKASDFQFKNVARLDESKFPAMLSTTALLIVPMSVSL